MNQDLPLSTDDGLEAPSIPPHEMLGRIEPGKQLLIKPLPPRASAEFDRIRNLQIGAAVLIGLLGLVAIPFGRRLVTFAFVAGIVFLIVGLLSSRTNVLIRNHLARRRAKKLGLVNYAHGVLISPCPSGPEQFNLNDPHTMLRGWQRTSIDGEAKTITSLLIAQDGQRTILFSDELSSSEEARDYGFVPEEVPTLNVTEAQDRVRVPLRALHELSRMIDKTREDAPKV